MIEIVLKENQAERRLDKVLQKHLGKAPTSFIYKMLRKKNITLNHKKADGTEKTALGDRVQFFFSDETYEKMRGEGEAPETSLLNFHKPADFPEISVLYEDGDVLLFVKPQGVLSQKSEEKDYSVNEWVVERALQKGSLTVEELKDFRPSVCNRLDRNTCGIMAAGLSMKGLQILSELLKDRTAEKEYYALVKGLVKEAADVTSYLLKDEKENQVRLFDHEVKNSKKIHTSYEPIKTSENRELTLLRVHLHTGRSHQIRAQLSTLGHPILGDSKYGDREFNQKYRQNMQCLCAYHMAFPKCDLTGISEKTFEISVPADWPLQ